MYILLSFIHTAARPLEKRIARGLPVLNFHATVSESVTVSDSITVICEYYYNALTRMPLDTHSLWRVPKQIVLGQNSWEFDALCHCINVRIQENENEQYVRWRAKGVLSSKYCSTTSYYSREKSSTVQIMSTRHKQEDKNPPQETEADVLPPSMVVLFFEIHS